MASSDNEILDVVDDQDQVIGSDTRFNVHQKNLKHRSIHVLIFRSTGEVFLQKRSMLKDNCPGMWDSSVSGHVDSGESYGICAHREIAEEVGITTALDLKWLMKTDARAAFGYEFANVYTAVYDEELFPDPLEIDKGAWLSPSELDQWMQKYPQQFTNTLLAIWSYYRQSIF